MHFLLTYDYTDDYLERRGTWRARHLGLAWEAHDRGELLLGGTTGEPADSGLLLFRCADAAVVERFVQGDPYFQQGLVRSYRIQAWNTVIGEQAAQPVRPD